MRVCIIGGGAAGMMAATLIAKKGHEVCLFEKNEKLGKKIYITGKGRCNVTNTAEKNDFYKNIVNGQKFMMGALSRFDSRDTMAFFEEMKIPLKVERGGRVFPQSDKSSDIIKGLEKAMRNAGVKVLLNSKIENIIAKDNNVAGIVCDGIKQNFDAVIVATGGISYASTGSTGDGYEFAKELGHMIVSPVQALCAIKLKNKELFCLQGLSLKNVKLTARYNEKIHYESEIGEMIFIQNGVSGPLVLSASSYVNRCDFENLKLYIDFKPALKREELLARIGNDIAGLKAKQVSTFLEGFLPKAMVEIFANRLKIDLKGKANQLDKSVRENFADMIKGFELVPLELESFDQAVVTSGGVNLKEINPKNMQSKIVGGLYFVGEVLDIDALTGGFNLQLAFSTAAACADDFENLI